VRKFWSHCKIGVKLQAAFALVMLIFAAALIGGFIENAKVEALTKLQEVTIVAGRSAANRLAIAIGRTDDVGAYYVGNRSANAVKYLTMYRQNVALFQSTFTEVASLADDDLQRALVAKMRTAADAPDGWLQGNEKAFALRAGGKFDAAAKVYFEAPPDDVYAAALAYQDDAQAEYTVSNAEVTRLYAYAKILGGDRRRRLRGHCRAHADPQTSGRRRSHRQVCFKLYPAQSRRERRRSARWRPSIQRRRITCATSSRALPSRVSR
jgi:hypothetical protein